MKIGILACLAFAGSLFAQTITSVQNPASNIPQALANGAVAEGSVIVIYGSKLGPAAIVLAPALPLTTSLGGTTISVTVGGTTLPVPLVYTLASQVAAVLPSATPVGTGTITVSFGGVTSPTFPIVVAKSAFGISTVNLTGGGPGVITFGTPVNGAYPVVTATKPGKPGDTLVIWGTGLGPANSDTNIATNGDLGTPITVSVGSATANITYRGRSAAPGLDQINFVVPAGVSGCNVSLSVQNGTIVSNITTIPLSADGSACSDPNGLSAAQNTALAAKANVKIAALTASQTSVSISVAGQTFNQTSAVGGATFQNYTQSAYAANNAANTISYGSCIVTITYGGSSSGTLPGITGLDAGASIAMTLPSGSVTTLTKTAGVTGTYGSGTSLAAAPGGLYKYNNGSGGVDVPAFSVSGTVSTPITWTNFGSISTIDRTQPLKVTWTGGDANTYLFIFGSQSFGTNNANNVQFQCTAAAAAGQFSIPSAVLLQLPATPAGGLAPGILAVGGANTQFVTIPTVDIATLSGTSFTVITPSYK